MTEVKEEKMTKDDFLTYYNNDDSYNSYNYCQYGSHGRAARRALELHNSIVHKFIDLIKSDVITGDNIEKISDYIELLEEMTDDVLYCIDD